MSDKRNTGKEKKKENRKFPYRRGGRNRVKCQICGKEVSRYSKKCRSCYNKNRPTGFKWSEERKERRKGEGNPMFGHSYGDIPCKKCGKIHIPGRGMLGKKQSDETRKKMRENNTKGMLGKHLTKEQKQKITDYSKKFYEEGGVNAMLGNKHTEESRKKMRETPCTHHKDRNHFNNAPENKQTMSKSEHSKLHIEQGDYGFKKGGIPWNKGIRYTHESRRNKRQE